MAGRLEQHQPPDLARLDLRQQAVDEPMMRRWIEFQQPPR